MKMNKSIFFQFLGCSTPFLGQIPLPNVSSDSFTDNSKEAQPWVPRFKQGRRLFWDWIIHRCCLLQSLGAQHLSSSDVLIQLRGQCLFYGLHHFYIGPDWQLSYGLTFHADILHQGTDSSVSLHFALRATMQQEEKWQCLGATWKIP